MNTLLWQEMNGEPRSLTLETSRCRLGFPEHRFAPRILNHVTDDRFPRNLPWASANTLEAVMDRLTRIHEKWDNGSAFCFTVTDKAHENYIGLVTISATEASTWAIAYMVTPSEWGQGYATECAGCVLNFAFESLSATKIWAGAAEKNEPSLRVSEKLGMRHFRSNPHGYKIDGDWVPTIEYQITANEWSHNKRMESNG